MKVTKSIQIGASAEDVWNALTDPELIKRYLFGTTVVTDWREGSPIVFKGNWHGTPFEDKGNVRRVEPRRLLEYTYWSSVLGLEDKPENYTITRYLLQETGDGINLEVTQDNLHSQPQQVQAYAPAYWEELLQSVKRIAEGSRAIRGKAPE